MPAFHTSRFQAGSAGARIGRILLFAGIGSLLVSCRGEDSAIGDEKAHDGFAPAVIAISHVSAQEKVGAVSGEIVLVDHDGAFDSISTSGFTGQGLVWHRGGLHASEGSREIRISSSTTTRVQRGGRYDMGEWSGTTGDHVINLFNVGTPEADSDDYRFGLSAWTGQADQPPLLNELNGDVLAAGACPGSAYVVQEDWKSGKNRRMVAVRADGERLTSRAVAAVEGPPSREPAWSVLFCHRGGVLSYTVGGASGAAQHVGRLDPATGHEQWTRLPVPLPMRSYAYEAVGVHGDELLAAVSADGDVMAIDIASGATRTVLRVPETAYNVKVSVDDGLLVVWQEYAERDPRAVVVDLDTNETLHDLTVSGLNEFRRSRGMYSDSQPVYTGSRGAKNDAEGQAQ